MSLRLLYLGPDHADVAVTRRVAGLRSAGGAVVPYAYLRKGDPVPGIGVLGHTIDGSIKNRIGGIRTALARLRQADIGPIDVIYARNLDLALVAMLFARRSKRHIPIIYEVLDIHPLLSAEGAKGRLARTLERQVLARAAGVVISSPAFANAYFKAIQGYDGPFFLLENKVEGLPDMALQETVKKAPNEMLTIVFSGKLRCSRSLDILNDLLKAKPGQVQVRLAGTPISEVQDSFDRLVSHPDVESLGRYTYPSDLERIYAGADLNWAIDFQSDFNAEHLIPNRLYEGGLFGIPPLVRKGTATEARAADWGCGISISDPFVETLCQLVDKDRDWLSVQKQTLAATPRGAFTVIDDYDKLVQFLRPD